MNRPASSLCCNTPLVRSQINDALLLAPATFSFMGEKLAVSIAEIPELPNSLTNCPVSTSHSRSLPPPDNKSLPSLEKATVVPISSVEILRSRFPFCVFQSWIVLSEPVEHPIIPFGANATAEIDPVCPEYVRSNRPVFASQTFKKWPLLPSGLYRDWSLPAAMILFPSEETASEVIEIGEVSSWPGPTTGTPAGSPLNSRMS